MITKKIDVLVAFRRDDNEVTIIGAVEQGQRNKSVLKELLYSAFQPDDEEDEKRLDNAIDNLCNGIYSMYYYNILMFDHTSLYVNL